MLDLSPVPAESVPSAADAPGEALQVLVVDDEIDDLLHIKELVESGQSTIRCDMAVGFDEGLSAMTGGGYHAYLVADRLGARAGLDLIRHASRFASGPLVLLTGVRDEQIDRLALAAGAADCLPKEGLTPEAVRRSIRYSVETWTAHRVAEAGYERFQSLFDGVPVGLFRADAEGRLLEVNVGAVEMLRYSTKADLLERRLLDLIADMPIPAPSVSELLSGTGRAQEDVELLRADGTRCWAALTLETVRDGSGAVVHVEGALVDVSRWKQAEKDASLRDTLLDQVDSAVIVADLDGICIFWNRAAEAMYGWTAAEAAGRPITELTVMDDDRDLAVEIMAEIRRIGHWHGEFRVRRRDGSTFIAQVSDSLVRDGEGRSVGIVGVSLDVTAQKEAAAELHTYHELVSAAFDASPVAKTIVSVSDGTIVSCNPALSSYLGYTTEQIVGMHFSEITHPDDREISTRMFQKMLEGEVPSYALDKRHLRADGSVAWGQLQASLIRDENGVARYALGQIVDITERKHAEDQIRFQASLLEQVPHPVIATDLGFNITYWNLPAESLYGWATDEVIGRDIFTVVAPNTDPDQLARARGSLLERGLWEGEVMLARKDGTTFPAWVRDALIRDSEGTPVGVVGVTVDLSEIRRVQEAVRKQEALSRSLLDAVDVPIAIFGPDGDVVASNRSWGPPVGDGKPAGSRPDGAPGGYLPATLAGHIGANLTREMAAGVSDVLDRRRDRFSLEFSVDSVRWIRMTVFPVAEVGVLVVHWDITDERRARSALEEIIRAKDEFIAAVSHELRTPLTVVAGLAETLRSQDLPPEELTEFHHLIANQAQEMALIVEDLLVAARLDSGTLTIRLEEAQLADEVETVLRPYLSEGVEISTELPPGLSVHADPLRVRQILRNLVSNSIRYGRPPIVITGAATPGRTVVEVTDHGDGIPPEASARVFEPYATFTKTRSQPSSVGIGLHVARRLAQLMGGDLGYHRRDGLTVFELTLPTGGGL